jgi:hypothetical protein
MSVLVFIKKMENGEGCRTEYLEGTAVAREKSEYMEMVMCD